MIDKAAGRCNRPTTEDVVGWCAELRTLATGSDPAGDSGAEAIDQIRALEELKSAAAAAQARATARFAADQREAQRAAGVPARDVGKGVGAQIALARRDSPAKGSQHLGLAEALVHEMPHTLAALEDGRISEWRSTLLVRETACLSREDRGTVDAELAQRPGGLAAMGDRAIAAEARRIGYRLDPHAAAARARKAEADRRVTLRPAPDTMTVLTALLPAKQGVAAYAALTRHADTLRAQGDARTRGQIMADTLVERVTGQTAAEAVPAEVNLVMTDTALLGADPEPADLEGYGPLPAPVVRDWLRGESTADGAAVTGAARVWLRRLFTAPDSGALVTMDSARRRFDGKLRRFVIIRDRFCRTPWCDAPIRHVDHPVGAAQQGPTTATNSQGLCEACNYAKELAGWRTRLRPDGAVETTTPTGHRHVTRPPVGIGRPPPRVGTSRLETHFHDVVLAC